MIDYSGLPQFPPDLDFMTAGDEWYPRHMAWMIEWHRLWWNNGRKDGKGIMGESYADLIGWSEDYLRALNARPRIVRLLIKWLMGGYAYRELVGLRDRLHQHGFDTTFEYGCENLDYHKDKVKLWHDLP